MKKTIIALALASVVAPAFATGGGTETLGETYVAAVYQSADDSGVVTTTVLRADAKKTQYDSAGDYLTAEEAKSLLTDLGLGDSYRDSYWYLKLNTAQESSEAKAASIDYVDAQDTALSSRIDTLAKDSVTKEYVDNVDKALLTEINQLDQRQDELVDAIKNEASNRTTMDEHLNSKISAEATDRANADNALQASITSLSGKVTSNAEAINNNKANIASLGNDVNSLKTSTDVNEANIIALNTKIDNEVEVLDKADEAIKESVKANTDLINQNTNGINSLNIVADDHEVRIADLESTVKDIEELGGDGNDRTTLNVKSESVKSSLTITPTATGSDYTYTLDFTDLEGNVSSLQTQVKDHDDSLTNAWRKLLANSANIANQGERITNAEVSISSVSNNVATNSMLIQNNTDAINANSERIDNTQADVAANTKAIKDEASTRLKADQALANSIESNASSIKIINQVNAIQDDAIKSNTTAIENNSTRLDTHYQYIKANRDDIDNLYDVTSTNTTDIANNAKNIASNTTRINDIEVIQDAQSELIISNSKSIKENRNNISTNTQNIKNVAQSVDEFRDVYNSFAQETVAWNQTQDQNIDNLFKAYESIKAQTVDYDNKFKQQDKRISRLENKMKKMDKRIDKAGAITTALAGIHYQQMHKGEGQIAGAVGGFGGESAIAFGVAVQTGETWQLNAQGAFGNGEVGWSVGFSKKF